MVFTLDHQLLAMRRTTLLLIFSASWMSAVNGARVLVITMAATSHCLEMAGIARELVARGHEVNFYYGDFFDTKPCLGDSKATVITYKVPKEDVDKANALLGESETKTFGEEDSFLQMIRKVQVITQLSCHALFSSGLDKLRGKFDIALIDAVAVFRCQYVIPVYLGIPLVAEASYIEPFDAFTPFPGAYLPNIIQPGSDLGTFVGRVKNTISYLIFRLVLRYLSNPVDRRQYGLGELFENLSEDDCIRNASLYLENSFYALDGPKPVFPNFVQIGAITARPPQKLPRDLQEFMDSAKEGVLLVSFGSVFQNAPSELLDRLLSAFQRLPFRVLFKLNEDRQVGNVKIVKWIPQNDVLGHNNTRAFMSHCGKNGMMEAVYHGVPILASPLHADNFGNAKALEDRGVGLTVDIRLASEDDIYTAASAILNDATYLNNMRRLSRILRDTPETAAERAARAIEHVLKYGSDHLRPSVAAHLNEFQQTMLDVWLLLLAGVMGIIGVVVFCIRGVCCRRKTECKKKKD